MAESISDLGGGDGSYIYFIHIFMKTTRGTTEKGYLAGAQWKTSSIYIFLKYPVMTNITKCNILLY